MASERKKRVLIITYYWPPSGGIGVLRCLKFAKYLRRQGWEPVIFTAKNAHYPTIDHSNDRDVPEGIEIIQQEIWEPYRIYKWFTKKPSDSNVNNVLYTEEKDGGWKHRLSVWIRSNFFIPDARAFWIKGSVKRLTAYLEEHPVDAILSDGPPHTNTRIATLLSQKTNTPWLADFQDPWTQVDYFQKLRLLKFRRRYHHRLEQEALSTAKALSIVSPSWKKDIEAIGATNVKVLYWGYDPEDFAEMKREPDKLFTLTHMGIMGPDRTPSVLFKAIAQLCQDVEQFADLFRLQLYGQVDHKVKEAIAAAGIEQQVLFGGTVSRSKALQLTLNSQLLLLLLNQQPNATGRIPGKLFEYLATSRPILNFGAENSDVANIIEDTRTGVSFTYEGQSEKIVNYLRTQFESFLTNGSVLLDKPQDIKQFSHPVLIGKLADWLTEISQ